ncbi:MAG: GTPase Era [Cellvibrionaceae bacterium]
MTTKDASEQPSCGYVAIVGRPNVGKSTLLNHILGQKLSITSRKPQTTRHNVLGIKTEGHTQAIYVDTPGQHSGQKKAINRYMNKAAVSAMLDVDVVVFVVDKMIWTEQDDQVAEALAHSKSPVILAINKIDQLPKKEDLLPYLRSVSEKLNVAEVVPLSALKNDNLDRLEDLVSSYLPKQQHLFDEEQITDRSVKFLAAEIIREKITRQLGDELPYQAAVEIEEFKDKVNATHISAVILIERKGQKNILIGDGGSRIKLIGQEARVEIETLIDRKVMLKLWVKVKSGWSDDERALRSLGFDDK